MLQRANEASKVLRATRKQTICKHDARPAELVIDEGGCVGDIESGDW